MATNPMQRKSRNAFLLGMIITLLVAAIVVAMLYMKIKSQKQTIESYQKTTSSVYVLNQDVESGQALTADMFLSKKVPTETIPADATGGDIATWISRYSFCDTEGNDIYYDVANSSYYYYVDENRNGSLDEETDKHQVYSDKNETVATALIVGEKYYYYAGANKTDLKEIMLDSTAVIAKTKLKANTIITTSLITRADERTTKDLREAEYNVINLPVDLITGEYVDIRFSLPNGQDYIVVSKKQVTVPDANGAYLTDTIQMNLTEAEILLLSCAIVENYQIEGSKLYAIKYTEAGLQEKAVLTYFPNNEVVNLINTDPNAVNYAIKKIEGRREEINDTLNKYGDEENISSEVDKSITSTQEARKQYLQSLPVTY